MPRPRTLLALPPAGLRILDQIRAGAALRHADGIWRLVDAEAQPLAFRQVHAERLLAEGYIRLRPCRPACLTDLGEQALRQMARALVGAKRQGTTRRQRGEDGTRLVVDLAESPLAWLAAHRDRAGRPYLADEEIAAGDRFRRDFTLAGLSPSLTIRWDALPQHTYADRLDFSDARLAARQRLDRALAVLGPDHGGLLLDVCGFLKPVGEVEAARGWPIRTGKVVVKLALASLARHYGLTDRLEGRSSAPVQAWGAADYRPCVPLSFQRAAE